MANIDFQTIVIVGAAVSLIQEFIQSKAWSAFAKRVLVIVLSLGAAAVYIALKDTAFWATFLSILTIASAVYAFLIRGIRDAVSD